MKNDSAQVNHNRGEDNSLRLQVVFVCIQERVKIEGGN